MRNLLDRRFLMVVGKGGTGKTTTAAALAVAAASQGKRTLIAMCNTRERLSPLFGTPPIGTEHRTLAPGIDAVNMSPETALAEYGAMVLRSKALYQAVFGNRLVSAFLRGTPGIDAWSMLGKAYFHAVGADASSDQGYDLVILDAPATGHALEMLRVPQVIVDVAPPGLLRREAAQALELFRDRERAGAVIVTLPEDMPTTETLELHQALTEELRIPTVALVINRVFPTLFGDDYFMSDLQLRVERQSPLWTLADAARRRLLRERQQAECIARLRETIAAPRIELPALLGPGFGRPEIDNLAAVFGPAAP